MYSVTMSEAKIRDTDYIHMAAATAMVIKYQQWHYAMATTVTARWR